nr:WD repeat-containing protein 38 isoform X2 [Gorilla gorilla gorilla]
MNSGVPATLAVRRAKFFGQHGGEVNSSAFSPDGQMLLTGSEDGCVYSWETRSGQLLWRLGGHTATSSPAPPVTALSACGMWQEQSVCGS